MLLAKKLKDKGYRFHLDMYGTGELEERTMLLAKELDVMDVVTFHGAKQNGIIHAAMRNTDIFLFTSDRYEGWGAVANESLSEECVLVASDGIGSSPYLISNGDNGFIYRSPKTSSSLNNPDRYALDSLCEKVEYLLNNPQKCKQMQQKAAIGMREIWSPGVAAKRLLALIQCLESGKGTPFSYGPCSKA